MINPIQFHTRYLSLLDQRLLPNEEVWIQCDSLEQSALAIERMVVRGAPAIGCTAAFGLAIDAVVLGGDTTWQDYKPRFTKNCARMGRTRPTAVNLFRTIRDFETLTSTFNDKISAEEFSRKMVELAEHIFDSDLKTCRAIGDQGSRIVPTGQKVSVLTHCNAGALATAGYGTALGVIRSLESEGKLDHVYVDETRPYLQGARLTAYELQQEGISHSLMIDSSAAYLMQLGKIDMVVVGADRITLNGDVANKIGTYSLAVNAKYHDVPFFVAAPLTTFDFELSRGDQINIEVRDPTEVSHFRGHPVSPPETPILNYSFDVTPNHLIRGIITERGILESPYEEKILDLLRN